MDIGKTLSVFLLGMKHCLEEFYVQTEFTLLLTICRPNHNVVKDLIVNGKERLSEKDSLKGREVCLSSPTDMVDRHNNQ